MASSWRRDWRRTIVKTITVILECDCGNSSDSVRSRLFEEMGLLVRMIVGDWVRHRQGVWRYVVDQTEVKYDVSIRENETYVSLLDIVKRKYKLEERLLPTEPVLLTYDYPDWMKVPGRYATPPVEIKEDGDVELFMSVKLDYADLPLCVSFGNMMVGRYLEQRLVEEEGLRQELNMALLNTSPPRVAVEEGWLACTQQVRVELSSDEEVDPVHRGSLGLTGEDVVPHGVDEEDMESSTDSCEDHDVLSVPKPNEGRVTLVGGTDVLMGEPCLALTIAGPVTVAGQITAMRDKGKGKLGEADHERGKYLTLELGSGSGGQSMPTAEEDSDCEILVGDDMGVRDHLYVGQVFLDRDAFKLHMSLYAMANKFGYRVKRSEPGKMVLQCNGASCFWRVYAAKLGGSPRFEIKTLRTTHTCSVEERSGFRRHATSSIIGDMLRNRYVGNGSGPRPRVVQEIMRTDHRVPITYWKAWKSREIAINRGSGNAEESYRALPAYLQHLTAANPGTVVALETTQGAGGAERFKYVFLAFGASVRGWPYMRKVVIIDGTHLKGKFSGCLLTASAQDGNHQIFPLAFAIVDGENDQAWTWFFAKLLEVVADDERLVFVSDRHTAIYSGIRKVYPKASHCACVLHLQRNVQSIFKKKHLVYLVARAARAFRLEDFYIHFNEIKVMDIACADYLIRIGLEHWARSHFGGERYNVMTSNLAESLNAALAQAREYAIVPLLDYIRSMMMGWFSSRRSAATANGNGPTPKVKEILTRNFTISTGYAVNHIINSEFEVCDDNRMYYRVNLQMRTCSCKAFDMLAIPCDHAVAAAVKAKHNVESLVAVEYSTSYWAMAYSDGINPTTPVSGESGNGGIVLLPPNTRRPPGRPRKTRMMSRGEYKMAGMFKSRRACGMCGGADHNRTTCKMPI